MEHTNVEDLWRKLNIQNTKVSRKSQMFVLFGTFMFTLLCLYNTTA